MQRPVAIALSERRSGGQSGATAADEFSNLVGEADQLYQTISEHLDTAAAELKALGHEIGGFGELCARHGLPWIVGSESSTAVSVVGSMTVGGLATQTTMSARANALGSLKWNIWWNIRI